MRLHNDRLTFICLKKDYKLLILLLQVLEYTVFELQVRISCVKGFS